ncbi:MULTISPECIES: hypothetical protein [Bacillus]|nr:hypothetical protein [Bacillus cereus]
MLINPIFSGSTLCSSFAYELPMKKMNNKDNVLKKLRKEDFRIDSTNDEEIRFSCKEYKFLLSMKSNQIKVLTTANSEFERCLINFLKDTLRKLFRNENIYI